MAGNSVVVRPTYEAEEEDHGRGGAAEKRGSLEGHGWTGVGGSMKRTLHDQPVVEGVPNQSGIPRRSPA